MSSAAEALAIARAFETGPNGYWDTNSFRLHFAINTFLSRALADWLPVRDLPTEFRQFLTKSCHKDFMEAWQNAGSVRLQRHVQKEDGLHCQYRLIQRSGQLNYWTLLIGRGEGQMGIIDAHDHSYVPWLRHIAEGAFLIALTDESWQKKLSGPKVAGLTPRVAADLREFLLRNFDEKSSQALEVYPRLPPKIQSMRFVRLTYASCLSATVPKASVPSEILNELTNFFSGSLVQELSELNKAYEDKNLYALMAAARTIRETNGPDAYLDVLQARVHRYHGALADAEEEVSRAVTAEPTLAEAHALLIDLALKSGDYPSVARRIRQQERLLGMDLRHMAERDEFADFARSASGRNWLLSHGSNTTTQVTGLRTNKVEASSRHKLQGVFLSKARPTALIDGRTVESGDRLPGGYVVQTITNQSVILVDASGQATVLRMK